MDQIDREKQAHLSLRTSNIPGQRPTLSIHDKNGRVHSCWTFDDIADMRMFGEQIVDLCRRTIEDEA